MCTMIVLYLMCSNSSLCFNWGDHSSNHMQGVTWSWTHIAVQAKNIFPDRQGNQRSWSLVYRPSCRCPWRTRNLFPRSRFIKGFVNSSHKRVATSAKGTVPTEVIRIKSPHHNSSKPLTNSQFHLHKHSKIPISSKVFAVMLFPTLQQGYYYSQSWQTG
jgi:hypothetical protein